MKHLHPNGECDDDCGSATSSVRRYKEKHLLPDGHDLSYRSHSHTGSVAPDHEGSGAVHWCGAAAVFYAFAMSSGITSAGYLVGSTGTVVAAFLLITITSASMLGSYMMGEIARTSPTCETFSDVGLVSFGAAGERIGGIIQFTNFVLFLPVAIDLCAEALAGALPNLFDCTDYYIFVICGFCLLTTQVRSVANTNTMSYMSCCLIVAIGAILMYESQDKEFVGKKSAQLAGNPVDGFKGVVVALLGATTVQWCYVPAFLTVELTQAMTHPKDLKKSLALSGFMTVATLGIVGYVTVEGWGWDLRNPVMISPAWSATKVSGSSTAKAVSWMLLFANLTGYLLDSVCLGRACAISWLGDFDLADWSLTGCLWYLLATVPTWLFGLFASLLVPNLFAMLAFTTALTVPQATCIYPAICYMKYFFPADSPGARRRGPVQAVNYVAPVFTLTVGIISAVICGIAAVGQVSYRDLRGPTVLGCSGWQILNDA
eukprot:TRINITY_DN51861_c0_g1_i1.p1 TRINITY_DN51861_c0_g1~~TRINITY_DN51861_c0_g1_i1.p1  ORF type:complete len:487 (+),score=110.15 TRINITY_DN51861_c0_g1_i1:134-1594(+)